MIELLFTVTMMYKFFVKLYKFATIYFNSCYTYDEEIGGNVCIGECRQRC